MNILKKLKPPPSTLHHIVLLSWYRYWRKPIYQLDTTGIQAQLVTFSLCLSSNFPTASAFAPWSDFSSSRSTAFRFLQRWKKGVVSWEAKGTPPNANPPPRNKALSMDYKPGLTRALFLGEGGIGGEGEKFPVIALDYQHRRSASALFRWLVASAKSWAKRCHGHTFVRFSYTVKWRGKLYISIA